MYHNDEQLKKLGQFFHEQRVGRQLTLKEASGDWSEATLSRFERGLTDISTNKALELMLRIGMDELDLLPYFETDQANFPLQLQEQIQMNDVPTLEAREANFFVAHPQDNSITQLAAIMFKAAKQWPRPDYHFSQQEEQLLADCLAAPERFHVLGVELYKAIVAPASHELLALLWHRAQTVPADSMQRRSMQEILLWLGALMNRDLPLADGIAAELAPRFADWQNNVSLIEFLPNWIYGQAVLDWLHDPTPEKFAQIQKIVDDLYAMGVVVDARWFELMLIRTRPGTVHHNHALKDRALHLPAATTAGEAIRCQRRLLKMTPADLNEILSPTSLHRFEKGQSQISFSTMIRLGGELALLPSQLFSIASTTPTDGTGVIISLRKVFKQIIADRPFTDTTVVLKMIADFTKQSPNMPPRIVATQRFILEAAAQIQFAGIEQPQQTAVEIFSQMLQTNKWSALEMHATEAIVDQLSPTQLDLLFQKGQKIILKNAAATIGINYYYGGLNRALLRVVTVFSQDVASTFLKQFKWLCSSADPTPMRWRATGSWFAGNYLLAPTAANEEQLARYVHRSMRVGHPDAITNLRDCWAAQLPAGMIDQLMASYQE